MTTEVALRVIETKPAVVNFNYQEISDHLDSVLEKYKGLVFTESTVTECKKTIAELRKGQKSLDEFRKTTKKQLTESVTAFENLCKVLFSKFEEVIQPLTQQNDQFELDRREKKRVEIQSVIDGFVADMGLLEKYASQLTIPGEYFNKGKTIKAIKAELGMLANTLKVQQDKELQDIDLIKTKVELANTQYQLTNVLMLDNYLRLLAYKSVAEIEELIRSDAQQIHEREKLAAEAVAAQTAETPKVVDVIHQEPIKEVQEVTTSVPASDLHWTAVMPKKITAVYEITGTEEQLSALEAYLDANGLSWLDRPND